jgi:hypothetical protein
MGPMLETSAAEVVRPFNYLFFFFFFFAVLGFELGPTP